MSCVLVSARSSCEQQQHQPSITNNQHQANGSSSAVAESHLTFSCCVFAIAGHSCKQQQQHCSLICIRLMLQPELLLNLIVPLFLSACENRAQLQAAIAAAQHY